MWVLIGDCSLSRRDVGLLVPVDPDPLLSGLLVELSIENISNMIEYAVKYEISTSMYSFKTRLHSSNIPNYLYAQWNLVITSSDITIPSYKEVVLLVPAHEL